MARKRKLAVEVKGYSGVIVRPGVIVRLCEDLQANRVCSFKFQGYSFSIQTFLRRKHHKYSD